MPAGANDQEAIRLAIGMETRSKEFYLAAAENYSDPPGKKLFSSLAREEEIHRRDFEKIYASLREKYVWPETETVTGQGRRKTPYLSGLTRKTSQSPGLVASELEAVKTAITMEDESYDFYRKLLAAANFPAEKEFFQAVSAVEYAHRLALLEYREYLTDPAGFFVAKEHPSLD